MKTIFKKELSQISIDLFLCHEIISKMDFYFCSELSSKARPSARA